MVMPLADLRLRVSQPLSVLLPAFAQLYKVSTNPAARAWAGKVAFSRRSFGNILSLGIHGFVLKKFTRGCI